MSVHTTQYWEITCDHPGCGTTTGDLGDYSAWNDRTTAEDQWVDADGYIDGETAYCDEHHPDRRPA